MMRDAEWYRLWNETAKQIEAVEQAKTRILLTGGEGAGTMLLAQALRDKGYHVERADADAEVGCHWVPLAGAENFPDHLIALCQKNAIDLLIPGVDEELPVMPIIRKAGIDVLVPDEWYTHIMLDKLGGFRELTRRGAKVVKTIIAKPRWGRGSRDVYVEQEELLGQEYTVCMAADKQGRLHACVPVRCDQKRGITIKGTTERNAEVISACQEIHRILPAAGCYNIQGKLTTEGFIPFEINPRVSTTTGLALYAGVDVVSIWLADGWRPGHAVELAPFDIVSLKRTWQNTIAFS